jgi:hypothetical protein
MASYPQTRIQTGCAYKIDWVFILSWVGLLAFCGLCDYGIIRLLGKVVESWS